MLLCFQFRPQSSCFGGVVGIVGPQVGGSVNLLLIGLEINDIPERRMRFAVEMRQGKCK
jgi:hypothetical protein